MPNIVKSGYGDQFIDLSKINSKIIVLDFWASWCGPCLKSVKSTLKPIYDDYDRTEVEIIGISNDKSGQKWQEAIEKWGMQWPNIWDEDRSIIRTYGVTMIPTYFILDGSGNLIDGYVYSRELPKKIKQALRSLE